MDAFWRLYGTSKPLLSAGSNPAPDTKKVNAKMGMYTTIKAEIVLKDELVPLIAALHNYEVTWKDILGPCAFVYMDRCSFIPNGGITYSNYPEPLPYKTLEGNVWKFYCSLKNYSSEIETFWKDVVPLIAESVTRFESWYEESDSPTIWVSPP